MLRALMGLIVAGVLTATSASAETLGDVLAGAGMSDVATSLPAAQPVTSYAYHRDGDSFLLAYYHTYPQDLNLLEDTLHLLYVDRGSGEVIRKDLLLPVALQPYDLRYLGSVLNIRKIDGRYFLQGHLSPSASPTLVLNADLSVHDLLPGWIVSVQEDKGIVFRHNTPHFGPRQEERLSRYDPIARRTYPLK